MTVVLLGKPQYFEHTRLLGRLVAVAIWCALVLGSSQVGQAGCYFGHAQESLLSGHSLESRGYARNFHILGKWVYEGGQIKYVAWQADGECQGPNCSSRKDLPLDSNDFSLPQRTHSYPALVEVDDHWVALNLIGSLPIKNAKALQCYSPAYEYPP